MMCYYLNVQFQGQRVKCIFNKFNHNITSIVHFCKLRGSIKENNDNAKTENIHNVSRIKNMSLFTKYPKILTALNYTAQMSVTKRGTNILSL